MAAQAWSVRPPERGGHDLSDLSWTAASNAWGPVERNRSNGEQAPGDGRPLSVGGQHYARGLGMHAGAEVRYALGGGCLTFSASVGVDDEVGDRGSVVFEVYGDGEKLYDSGVLTGALGAQNLDVSVAGVRELRLVTTDGGDGIDHDHADWADPHVECLTAAALTPGRAGTPDTSFGAGGRIPYGGIDAALGADGTLYLLNAVGGDFALRRYGPDGQTAEVTTDVSGQDKPTAVAVQPDGRIVAVGTADGGENVALVRYHPDLSLDLSFGGGGRVVSDLGGEGEAGANELANDVAVRPDGRLVVVGALHHPVPELGGRSANHDYLVAQYRPDGTLDPAFGRGGVVVTALPKGGGSAYTSDDVLQAVALQPDGKIVGVGVMDCAAEHAGIIRYHAGGGVDMDFLPNRENFGPLFTCPNFTADHYSRFGAVALAPGGRIVVGGWTGRFAASTHVSRFNSDGSLDGSKTFRLLDPTRPSFHQNRSVLVAGDGRVWADEAEVSAGTPGRLARLNPDLSFDATFGEQGGGVIPAGGVLLLQPDGKVLAVSRQGTLRLWP